MQLFRLVLVYCSQSLFIAETMPLSNAERQYRWRQRQREKNKEEYLKRERVRKRGKYVPTRDLSDEKKEERRRKGRNDFGKHYQKVKQMREQESKECEDQSKKNRKLRIDVPLQVKLSFGQNQKACGVKKRHAQALRKAYRDM